MATWCSVAVGAGVRKIVAEEETRNQRPNPKTRKENEHKQGIFLVAPTVLCLLLPLCLRGTVSLGKSSKPPSPQKNSYNLSLLLSPTFWEKYACIYGCETVHAGAFQEIRVPSVKRVFLIITFLPEAYYALCFAGEGRLWLACAGLK